MNFLKTKTGRALLGAIVALGVLAGTLLNGTDMHVVSEPVMVEVQQVAD